VERNTSPWKLVVYGVLLGGVLVLVCTSCCYFKRNFISERTKALPGIIRGTTTDSVATKMLTKLETDIYNWKVKVLRLGNRENVAPHDETEIEKTLQEIERKERELLRMQKTLTEQRLKDLKTAKVKFEDPANPPERRAPPAAKKMEKDDPQLDDNKDNRASIKKENVESEKKKSSKKTRAEIHTDVIKLLRKPPPPPPATPPKKEDDPDKIEKVPMEDLGSDREEDN
jgi:hypothetical protein